MHISVSFWTFCLYNWLSIYFLNQYYTTLIISFKMLVDNFPLNSYLFLKLLMLVSSFFQTIYRIIWLRSLEVQLRFCFKLYHHLRGKWTFQNTQTIQERNQSKHDFSKTWNIWQDVSSLFTFYIKHLFKPLFFAQAQDRND